MVESSSQVRSGGVHQRNAVGHLLHGGENPKLLAPDLLQDERRNRKGTLTHTSTTLQG